MIALFLLQISVLVGPWTGTLRVLSKVKRCVLLNTQMHLACFHGFVSKETTYESNTINGSIETIQNILYFVC